MNKYYVTRYEEYPIYEPAEGGYYYVGSHNVWVREFSSWKKAKRFFNKVSKEFMQQFEYKNIICIHRCPNAFVKTTSKYIGEDIGIELTYGEPLKEHGWEPYC